MAPWQTRSSHRAAVRPPPSSWGFHACARWRGFTEGLLSPAPDRATEGRHPGCISQPQSPRVPGPSPHPGTDEAATEDAAFPPPAGREAARSQQMEPPSAPRPLANKNARARGIPGAARASPSWALSIRALHPKGSRKRGWPPWGAGRAGSSPRTLEPPLPRALPAARVQRGPAGPALPEPSGPPSCLGHMATQAPPGRSSLVPSRSLLGTALALLTPGTGPPCPGQALDGRTRGVVERTQCGGHQPGRAETPPSPSPGQVTLLSGTIFSNRSSSSLGQRPS